MVGMLLPIDCLPGPARAVVGSRLATAAPDAIRPHTRRRVVVWNTPPQFEHEH